MVIVVVFVVVCGLWLIGDFFLCFRFLNSLACTVRYYLSPIHSTDGRRYYLLVGSYRYRWDLTVICGLALTVICGLALTVIDRLFPTGKKGCRRREEPRGSHDEKRSKKTSVGYLYSFIIHTFV